MFTALQTGNGISSRVLARLLLPVTWFVVLVPKASCLLASSWRRMDWDSRRNLMAAGARLQTNPRMA